LLIRRGLAALDRALGVGEPVGPYTLQAAIAACHARALSAADTDWSAVVEWYDLLVSVWPTPVVHLNRAIAVAEAQGAAAGLAELEARVPGDALAGYPQLAAARGELLARLDRTAEAVEQFELAARLTRNDAERALFRRRTREL
jgi:predicted RNA polymerase sigma factor